MAKKQAVKKGGFQRKQLDIREDIQRAHDRVADDLKQLLSKSSGAFMSAPEISGTLHHAMLNLDGFVRGRDPEKIQAALSEIAGVCIAGIASMNAK